MEGANQAKLEQLFDNYCTDGVVTRDAFKTILQVLENNPTDEAVDTVFEHFDKDTVPGLSKDEYNDWISKCLVSQDQARTDIVEALNVLFATSDNSEAGYPIDDLLEILKSKGNEQLNEEEAEEFRQELQTIDLSGDGTITAQELSTFFNPGEIQVDESPEAQKEQEDQAPEELTETQEEQTEEQTETQEEQTEEQTETQEEQTEEQTETQEEQTETHEGETQEGEQTETQEGEQNETQGEQTEGQDGEKTETQEGEQTETQEGEQTEGQDGEKTETPEGEQTENNDQS